MVASPKLPVLNTPGQMRRAAGLLLPAASGAPLIKSTRELKVRRVWLDGTASCDYDMIETPDRAQKYLPQFWQRSFNKFVEWQEKEGYVLCQYDPAARAPSARRQGYTWYQWSGRCWVAGPFEKIVLGGNRIKDVDPRTGREFYTEVARKQTEGEERLNETGGLITYRFGSFFNVREHLAELPVVTASRRKR